VGRERLHAHVRGAVAARRANRRPVGAAAPVSWGPRRLHARVVALWARTIGKRAHRLPRDPGAGRRRDDTGRVVDPDDDLRRGRRPQQGDRRLGGRRRARRDGGLGDRWPARGRPRLGVGLLSECADRAGAARAGGPAASGEPRCSGHAQLRPARRAYGHGRARTAHVHACRRAECRMGIDVHGLTLHTRGRTARLLRRDRETGAAPADATAHLPVALARRGECRAGLCRGLYTRCRSC
jgi:hypothetical protein